MPPHAAPLTHEPRFRDPGLADDIDPVWAVRREAIKDALAAFWNANSEIADIADRLDRWAGLHERRAEAGDARAEAAAEIAALTGPLEKTLRLLQAVETNAGRACA